MKDNIDKLKEELLRPISEESQIFCIFIRIRKALELAKCKEKYNLLNFYCNWLLHIEIEKVPKKYKEKIIKQDSLGIISFIHLSDLRKELRDFFKEFNLSWSVISNEKEWLSFKKKILGIYKDTPLIIVTVKKYIFVIDSQEIDMGVGDKVHIVSFGVKKSI